MTRANVHDRSSVERLYSRAAFARDAAANADVKTAVLHGVRLTARADAQGNFALAQASWHVGERDPQGDTVFLAPQVRSHDASLAQETSYGGTEEKADVFAGAAAEASAYERFIDRIIAAAKEMGAKTPIGQGDERLRGFRGG